jgi:putative tryptophan/tyrosine transport system substrate-binding protein
MNFCSSSGLYFWSSLRTAARRCSVERSSLDVVAASCLISLFNSVRLAAVIFTGFSPVATAADIEHAIESVAGASNGGLLLPPDGTTIMHRDLLIALAARHKLPAVYAFNFFVAAGGLMSYAADQDDVFRLAASYVDRILRGDKFADLPVQAPTKFGTTINVRTAKALDITIPPGLLVAADEVIE